MTLKAALLLATALVLAPTASRAGLQSEMDAMLGTMSNVTPPGVYENQTRGVLSGGQVTVKSRITNENLVSFVPPSFSAGCGGIDFFAGSFSFINMEQFTELLRNVASNAAGYAFYIALDVACPTCKQTIETLQQKIQQLNEHFGNSCQMAQGLVTDVRSAITRGEVTDTGLIGTTKGVFTDTFNALGNAAAKDPIAELANNSNGEEQLTGNIVWRALIDTNAVGRFATADSQMLQIIQSITGTVIVTIADDDEKTGKTYKKDFLPGGYVKIRDLIEGNGELKYKTCADGVGAEQCLVLGDGKIVGFKGFSALVHEMLLGTGATTGIVSKLANELPLSDGEKGFLASLGGVIGTTIVQMAVKGGEVAATSYAREVAPLVAMEMAEQIIWDMVRVAQNAVMGEKTAQADKLIKSLSERQFELTNERQAAQAKYGNVDSKITLYRHTLHFMDLATRK
ncbi:MAG: conjugal transfer protein TraH [Alphaproteobacteria bacterium]|nr:conjugal transfer protein TraH [Alphaproteobacteria bacterium]